MTPEEEKLNQRFTAIESRLARIEERLKSGSNSIKLMVFDKEHDRVLDKLRSLNNTYAAHQAWSESDRQERMRLIKRRNELRRVLGIQL